MMKLASGSVSGGVTCLQNCCKLRFLTALEITTITQCSGKRLILMLKKLHQVIFSRLAGYEYRREQTTVVL
jgi:hypothetical protein